MSNEMECMCMACGMSSYIPADLITMDPSVYDSNLIDSLLVCQNCGGKLKLVGKSGGEPFYRLNWL